MKDSENEDSDFLRDKLFHYEEPADDDAWEKLRRDLDQKSRRRRFFWWLFPGVLVAVLGTVFLYPFARKSSTIVLHPVQNQAAADQKSTRTLPGASQPKVKKSIEPHQTGPDQDPSNKAENLASTASTDGKPGRRELANPEGGISQGNREVKRENPNRFPASKPLPGNRKPVVAQASRRKSVVDGSAGQEDIRTKVENLSSKVVSDYSSNRNTKSTAYTVRGERTTAHRKFRTRHKKETIASSVGIPKINLNQTSSADAVKTSGTDLPESVGQNPVQPFPQANTPASSFGSLSEPAKSESNQPTIALHDSSMRENLDSTGPNPVQISENGAHNQVKSDSSQTVGPQKRLEWSFHGGILALFQQAEFSPQPADLESASRPVLSSLQNSPMIEMSLAGLLRFHRWMAFRLGAGLAYWQQKARLEPKPGLRSEVQFQSTQPGFFAAQPLVDPSLATTKYQHWIMPWLLPQLELRAGERSSFAFRAGLQTSLLQNLASNTHDKTSGNLNFSGAYGLVYRKSRWEFEMKVVQQRLKEQAIPGVRQSRARNLWVGFVFGYRF